MVKARPANKRSEVVQRLLAGKCELCGRKEELIQVHHIRKLADIDKPGRRPKARGVSEFGKSVIR